MSALFQGYCEPDGKVRVTADAGSAVGFHRGLAVSTDAVVAQVYSGTPPDAWLNGIGVTSQGHLLVSYAPKAGNAPGGLGVDANSILLVSETVAVFHQGVGLDTEGEIAAQGLLVYQFDGADQYASMPAWSPLGFPFSISSEQVLDATGADRAMVGDDSTGVFHCEVSSIGLLLTEFQDSVGTQLMLSSGVVAAGTQFDCTFTYDADGATVTGTIGSGSSTKVFDMADAQDLQRIGANGNSDFFDGWIRNLRLTDNSPLHGRDVMYGNGSRYAIIPIAILGGDFDISLSVIRAEVGASSQAIAGDIVNLTGLHIHDTDSATPDRVTIRIFNVDTNFDNALANIQVGQHFRIEVQRRGSNAELFIDGVSQGTLACQSGTAFFDQIAASAMTNAVPTNGAVGDVVINDILASRRYEYLVNEGSGIRVTNTDPDTGDQTLKFTSNSQFNTTIDPWEETSAGANISWDNGRLYMKPDANNKGAATPTLFRADYGGVIRVSFDWEVKQWASGNVIQVSAGSTPLSTAYGTELIFIDGSENSGSSTVYLSATNPSAYADFLQIKPGAINPNSTEVWIDNVEVHLVSNGYWDDDGGWTDVPSNSRHYPMGEGTGATLNDTIGGHDATIINFDEGNWVVPT